MAIVIDPNLKAKYKGYYSGSISQWRYLGAKQKVQNAIDVSVGQNWGKVLEVGAGDGSVLQLLDDNAFAEELYAVEISESGIEQIQQKDIERLVEAKLFDGYSIPYPDKYFDLIILTHVLEHVEHPRILLKEMQRVSRYQIIEVPRDYKTHVDKKIDQLLDYGHIWVFTPTMLRFLVRSEGMVVLNEKMSFYSDELLWYQIEKKGNMGILSKIKFKIYLTLRDIAYALAPASRKETMINAFTVLTQSPV